MVKYNCGIKISMTVNVKKFLIVLFILFGGISASVADGSYKNELTKVSLTPIGRDDVKITLYEIFFNE